MENVDVFINCPQNFTPKDAAMYLIESETPLLYNYDGRLEF